MTSTPNNHTPPTILTDMGLNMYVDTVKLRELPLPIVDMHIQDLIWHFDMSVWAKDGTDEWNLTPWDVIRGVEGSTNHKNRTAEADPQYPILVTNYKSRYVILDGVHRLTKIYLQGKDSIRAKMIPAEYLSRKDYQT